VGKMKDFGICKDCVHFKKKSTGKGFVWVCEASKIEMTGYIPITFCTKYKKRKVRL